MSGQQPQFSSSAFSPAAARQSSITLLRNVETGDHRLVTSISTRCAPGGRRRRRPSAAATHPPPRYPPPPTRRYCSLLAACTAAGRAQRCCASTCAAGGWSWRTIAAPRAPTKARWAGAGVSLPAWLETLPPYPSSCPPLTFQSTPLTPWHLMHTPTERGDRPPVPGRRL